MSSVDVDVQPAAQLLRRSSSKRLTNRSSLTSDSRLRSMVATPGNLHRYLDDQRRAARSNGSRDLAEDGTMSTDDLFSPITRSSSFTLGATDITAVEHTTSFSDEEDADLELEWGLEPQRAHTNGRATCSGQTYESSTDSDPCANGRKHKSHATGGRVCASNVPATRNVALTPWGTPVQDAKQKSLQRVPSMPIGELIPIAGERTAAGDGDGGFQDDDVDKSRSSALLYSRKNSMRVMSLARSNSRNTIVKEEVVAETAVRARAEPLLPGPKYKAGYLQKRGAGKGVVGRKNWLTRYVVLETGIIRYYECKSDYDAKKPCIKGTTINATLAAFQDDPEGDFCFWITSKQPGVRPFQFRASSEEERRSWQEALMSWNMAHIDFSSVAFSRPTESAAEDGASAQCSDSEFDF